MQSCGAMNTVAKQLPHLGIRDIAVKAVERPNEEPGV